MDSSCSSKRTNKIETYEMWKSTRFREGSIFDHDKYVKRVCRSFKLLFPVTVVMCLPGAAEHNFRCRCNQQWSTDRSSQLPSHVWRPRWLHRRFCWRAWMRRKHQRRWRRSVIQCCLQWCSDIFVVWNHSRYLVIILLSLFRLFTLFY